VIQPFKHSLYLLFITVPIAHNAMGQIFNDTLSSVSVTTNKWLKSNDIKSEMNIGQTADTIDRPTLERYQQLSLATLVSQQSPAFVRSYGVNSSATLSFRGASAAQSMVLWKGIPLANPSLGVTDITLLQTSLFDNVSLQYGGNAALLGSGNVGGALLLDDVSYQLEKRKSAIHLGLGSFGHQSVSAQSKWQNAKWQFSLRGFYQAMRNDFEYVDYDSQAHTTTNANLKAFGGITTVKYQINQRQNVSLDLWYQKYHRALPKALFEDTSTKKQDDIAFRNLLQWNYSGKLGKLYAKFSLNSERLNYEDVYYNIFNKNQFQQYYQELGWKQSFQVKESNALHHVLLTTPFQYAWINLKDGTRQVQSQPAVALAYQYLHGMQRLGMQVNIRQGWLQHAATPFLAGAGVQYTAIQFAQWHLKAKVSVQKTYRVPTLNELYNEPGGNKELLPEQGWNKEAGYDLAWESKNAAWRLKHQASYFTREIQDWIYWLGGSVWTPYNLAKVHNRGTETNTQVHFKPQENLSLHLGLKTAYVLSTTLASYMPNDGSIGKQIPYAPRYSGNANLGCSWHRFSLNYNHTYTGYRFVTTDESIFLTPYHLGNLHGNYPINFHKTTLNISLQVQNIWNKQYQVIAHRPMPSRYFLAGLSFDF
jgi:vitamin B12 transporter